MAVLDSDLGDEPDCTALRRAGKQALDCCEEVRVVEDVRLPMSRGEMAVLEAEPGLEEEHGLP